MQHIVDTQWMGNMRFNALYDTHTILMDAPPKSGGDDYAPIPKPFVLTALSGCTGMDVVAVLRKKSISLDNFDIKVEGELSKTAPITYTHINLVYSIAGNTAYAADVLQAVSDSQEKYCGVSALLKKAIPVTWQVVYNGEELFNNRKVAE
jgi:putative redox protein